MSGGKEYAAHDENGDSGAVSIIAQGLEKGFVSTKAWTQAPVGPSEDDKEYCENDVPITA